MQGRVHGFAAREERDGVGRGGGSGGGSEEVVVGVGVRRETRGGEVRVVRREGGREAVRGEDAASMARRAARQYVHGGRVGRRRRAVVGRAVAAAAAVPGRSRGQVVVVVVRGETREVVVGRRSSWARQAERAVRRAVLRHGRADDGPAVLRDDGVDAEGAGGTRLEAGGHLHHGATTRARRAETSGRSASVGQGPGGFR